MSGRSIDFELFFMHSTDLLAIAGTDGYFKRVNPAFERILGYSEAELLARPMVDFMHPDDVAKTKRGIEVLAAGTPRILSRNRYRCKDGTYRHFAWNTTPVGDVLYTLGRDISDQVAAEEQVRRLNQELARQNAELEDRIVARVAELRSSQAQIQQLQKMDAVGRLAGGVAHDFNNMLGAITMYCDLLDEDAGDPGLVRGHSRDVRRAAERGAALTRQLLIFSRKHVVQPETIDLNALIDQLRKMLARVIGEQNEIVTNLAADLKAIRVDPSQMEQVVMNLVVNARDAMKDGGQILIETSNVHLDEAFTSTHLTVEPGHYVRLSISDTGHGMDTATLAQIFDPFFTTKPVGKGNGLGLTATYGIVKQSRGTIWVYSEPGKGTVFKIYLPVADPVARAEVAEAARPAMTEENRTVLLVEDDERLRDGFTRMLRKAGFAVVAASNGEDALAILGRPECAVHVMVTDVIMPGINGFELAKRASFARPALRVLYMSGYTDDALETRGQPLPSEMVYLQKPFNTSELVRKIREVLAA